MPQRTITIDETELDRLIRNAIWQETSQLQDRVEELEAALAGRSRFVDRELRHIKAWVIDLDDQFVEVRSEIDRGLEAPRRTAVEQDEEICKLWEQVQDLVGLTEDAVGEAPPPQPPSNAVATLERIRAISTPRFTDRHPRS